MATTSNKLSWWMIDDARAEVAIAIASTRDNLSHIDFAVVALEDIESLAIQWERAAASTPYAPANHRHCDLLNLSVRAVAKLADHLHERREDIDRIRRRDVGDLLIDAIGRGDLDLAKLRNGLLSEIAQRLCTMKDPDEGAREAVLTEIRLQLEAGDLDLGTLDGKVQEHVARLEVATD